MRIAKRVSGHRKWIPVISNFYKRLKINLRKDLNMSQDTHQGGTKYK